MIEFIKNPNIDFMGKRKLALGFSAVVITLGLFAMLQIGLGKANMGIDFAGGTSVQVKFEGGTVSSADIRSALDDAGLKGFDLQDLPTESKVLVTVKKSDEKLGKASDVIINTLSTKFADKKPVVDSTTEIGPKVGQRLRKDALFAIVASVIGLLAYIAYRFKFVYGIGATVATFHDVFGVLAIFYLMGKEINLIIVSALLMVAGYSLTDTVVVFDRIRENLRSRYRADISSVINQSINEVLSRTIIVSFTTFLSALALFIFGGEVIHDFSLAIILGIVIGTYSSIFVASPVLILWKGEQGFAKQH